MNDIEDVEDIEIIRKSISHKDATEGDVVARQRVELRIDKKYETKQLFVLSKPNGNINITERPEEIK